MSVLPDASKKAGRGVVVGAVLLLFCCSGATGLIYEIAWTRLLRLVIGNTTIAITTVLCAFMGGLALGSFWGGRLADRRQDWLRLYGWLEGAIGLYCLLLPLIIGGAQPFYRYVYQHFQTSFYVFSFIRFVICGLILLVPASLMGMTLPILSRFVVRSGQRIGWPVGRLYSINTFGAVLGCVVGGFIMIPQLGIHTTIYITTAINGLICVVALLLQARLGRESADAAPIAAATAAADSLPTDLPTGAAATRWLLIGYALSGAAALIYEIAWTRTLALILGSSTYAFSLMLTAFILGLAIGSYVFALWVDRWRRPLMGLGIVEILVAVTALLIVPVFGQLPLYIGRFIVRFQYSFWVLQAAEFGLVLLLLLAPTILLGATFPLINRLCVRMDSVGTTVGRLYAWNTFGSIVGSFAGGFILIPWVGIQRSILIAVALNAVIGGAWLLVSTAGGRTWKLALGAGLPVLIAVACVLLPPWDPSYMSSGAYLTTRYVVDLRKTTAADLARDLHTHHAVRYYKEGVSTTVTVKQNIKGALTLYVNGKADASTGNDMATQELSGHLPMLFHPHPRRVLTIGLASGVTVGSVGLHPTVEQIDAVEIEPAMANATRYFEKYNYHILDDPRLHLITEDGRLHAMLTDQMYDVIISEPSNPWIAGVANLFTQEFFELCRAHLNPGGVICIWVQGYNIDDQTVRSIVRTFTTVFPHVTMWEPIPADYLLVGSMTPLQLDYGTLAKWLATEPVHTDLGALGIHEPQDLLAKFVMDDTALREFAGDAPLHTDDRTFLEFTAPLHLLDQTSGLRTSEAVNQYRGQGFNFVTATPEDSAFWSEVNTRVTKQLSAERTQLAAGSEYALGLLADQRSAAEAAPYYRAAIAANPNLPEALNNLAWIAATNPDTKLHDPQLAVRLAERATKLIHGDNITILDTLGAAYAAAQRFDDAVVAATRARDLALTNREPAQATEIDARIKLYSAHQSYRTDPH